MKNIYLKRILASLCAVTLLCMSCGCSIKKQTAKNDTITVDYTEYYNYDEDANRAKFEDMSVDELTAYAKDKGIDINGLTEKEDIINKILSYQKKEATEEAKKEAAAVSSGTSAPNTDIAVGSKDGSEAKLTGNFELQIFAGGYGSECWEKAIDGFQKLNPDLEIDAHLDSTVNSQMSKRWSNGNPPDFVFLDGSNMPIDTWADSGLLLDLTNFYSNSNVYGTTNKISDKINSGIVVKRNNRIYQLPVFISTYGMWYDSAYFSKNNYTVPKNYDELNSLCSTLKSNGIAGLTYPGQYSGYLVWGAVMPAVAAYGQEYFDSVCSASNGSVFTDNRFKSVLTKLKSLADNGYFLDGSLQYSHITSQTYWLNHDAALIPNGLWLETEMASSTPADFKMRYYPSMLQDANQNTCIIETSAGVGVATKAKNPEAALAFIRYLYTDKVASYFTELSGSPSAATIETSNLKISESEKDVISILGSNNYTHISKNSNWGTFDATINDVINKIIDHSYDVDTACKKLKDAADKMNAE